MDSTKPVDIANKLRRGSLDSNIGRRDSMESAGSSMQEGRSSFDGGRSVDEGRLQAWKDMRDKKKMWEQLDSTTGVWSA